MRILAAQFSPTPGNIECNLIKHTELIEAACRNKADLILFSELSVIGYEPTLAKSLATTTQDTRFDYIQELSNKYQLIIAVGLVLKKEKGNAISLAFFQPMKGRLTYSKQILHEDEKPYFISGEKQVFIKFHNEMLAPAICFESLTPTHSNHAVEAGATVYLASVAKDQVSVRKAYKYYSLLSKENGMAVLMANCYGSCDNFTGFGSSAVWDKQGIRLAELNNNSDGLVGLDTVTGKSIVVYVDHSNVNKE